MKRREFMTLLGGAAVTPSLWPLVARAQRAGIAKVGVLMAGLESAPDNQVRLAAFRQGFADLGWKDGDNVHVEIRWSEGKTELMRRYAEELVALAPDVILANSTPVVTVLKSLTDSVPVVFALATDPVGLGHVKSLSHPGGNITGFTFIDPDLIGKWMELLKDVSPGVTQASALFNPATSPFYDAFARQITAARQPGAIELIAMPVGNDGEMEAALQGLATRPGSSLIVGPDPFNQVRIQRIAQLAGQNRLPAISVYRPFATEGGLMAYGPDTADVFRRIGGLCRSYSQGRKTGRPAGAAADQVRIHHQPQDRQGVRL
jgi:putative ABC transport system substrate-binding protein